MGAPSFSGRGGGGGGGGGGQYRARERHLTAANTLSAFGRFNQWVVGAVRFQPIQPVGGAHVCKLLLQGGALFSPPGDAHAM